MQSVIKKESEGEWVKKDSPLLKLLFIMLLDETDSVSSAHVDYGETYTLGCIFKVGDDVRQVICCIIIEAIIIIDMTIIISYCHCYFYYI